MNQKEIQELIKSVAKAGVTEVSIEMKDFKITIKAAAAEQSEREEKVVYIQPQVQTIPQQTPVAVPQQQTPTAPVQTAETTSASTPVVTEEANKYITIKSPMIGTFYRAPSPEKPAHVEVGDKIKPGDTICVIEAMKLFNEIEAEISGTIVKVLVDNATPVEYDQPLFLVDPA